MEKHNNDETGSGLAVDSVSTGYAVAYPRMSMSGGCMGYDIKLKGSFWECYESPVRSGRVIIEDNDEQEEVAWAEGRQWAVDDESLLHNVEDERDMEAKP